MTTKRFFTLLILVAGTLSLLGISKPAAAQEQWLKLQRINNTKKVHYLKPGRLMRFELVDSSKVTHASKYSRPELVFGRIDSLSPGMIHLQGGKTLALARVGGLSYENSDNGYVTSVAVATGISLVAFTGAVINLSNNGNPTAFALWITTMTISSIIASVLTIFDGGKRKRLYDVQNTWIVSIVPAPR